jgi:glycosyltransferase involved in cell wall biosynthesis
MASAKAKVLVALNYYHPYVSGLSEYARLGAEAMADDYDVTVLTGQHDLSLRSNETVNGVTIRRAKPLFFLHKGYVSTDFIRHYHFLSRSADLVHLHLPMLEASLLAICTPRTLPLLSTYHCDVTAMGSWVDRLATAAVRSSCRFCLRRSRRIVVSSNDYARGSPVLRGFESRWVEIFPPGKELGEESAQGTISANHRAVRVGFLGRFVREKGIDILLDAIPLVLRQFPDAKFVLAGEFERVAGGTVYDEIKPQLERLGTNIELPGRLDDAQLGAFYRSLDVFVLPSVNAYEAFGMVQIEAMRAGVPVVAADRRGMRVPIQVTGNGRLVPQGNPGALAAAISSLLAQAHLLNRKEVAERANRAFANSAAFRRYQDLYRSLL